MFEFVMCEHNIGCKKSAPFEVAQNGNKKS